MLSETKQNDSQTIEYIRNKTIEYIRNKTIEYIENKNNEIHKKIAKYHNKTIFPFHIVEKNISNRGYVLQVSLY